MEVHNLRKELERYQTQEESMRKLSDSFKKLEAAQNAIRKENNKLSDALKYEVNLKVQYMTQLRQQESLASIQNQQKNVGMNKIKS